MGIDTLLCGKFFRCVRGDSLILDPHLCGTARGFFLRPCLSARVYWPGFCFFCFFDYEVSSATVSAVSSAGLPQFIASC